MALRSEVTVATEHLKNVGQRIDNLADDLRDLLAYIKENSAAIIAGLPQTAPEEIGGTGVTQAQMLIDVSAAASAYKLLTGSNEFDSLFNAAGIVQYTSAQLQAAVGKRRLL